MYYQNKQSEHIVFSAFRVTRANFTGEAFDNAPFEGDTGHEWLEQAMAAGVVSLVPSGETTYAVWGVRTPDGEIMLASPGDYIVQHMATETLHVCPGPLWEFLTEFVPEREKEPLPTSEEVEQAVTDAQDRVQVAYDLIEKAKREVLYGQDVDWGELYGRLKSDIEDVLGEHLPEGYMEVRDAVTHCWMTSQGQREMDPSKVNMRHLAMDTYRLAYHWLDGGGAAVLQQQLAFAKHAFGDDKPDGWEQTEKHVDECAEREDIAAGVFKQDLQKTKIARKAQGTKDYCVAMYHNGRDLSPEQWEKVRWSMAWAKMILGNPVSESDDPIYDELAKRAKYGPYSEGLVENMPATIFPAGTVLIQDAQGVVHGTAHVGEEIQLGSNLKAVLASGDVLGQWEAKVEETLKMGPETKLFAWVKLEEEFLAIPGIEEVKGNLPISTRRNLAMVARLAGIQREPGASESWRCVPMVQNEANRIFPDEVVMNAYCDRGYLMFEKVKHGEQFDWAAFHAEGLAIGDPDVMDQQLVCAKVIRMAGYLAKEEGHIIHETVEIARIKSEIVNRQKQAMYDELEVVNTARMWIFETASREERDWMSMPQKLWKARIILSIHNALPEDFEKIAKAVDHMVGSHPLGE